MYRDTRHVAAMLRIVTYPPLNSMPPLSFSLVAKLCRLLCLRTRLVRGGFLILLGGSSVANGATKIWAGRPGVGQWGNGISWNAGQIVINEDSIVFNSSGTSNNNNITNLQLNGISFGANAGAFTLMGNRLALLAGTGLVNQNTNNLQRIALSISLVESTPAFTVAGGRTIITGAMSGSGGLVVSGGGTLSLNGVNTFTGATVLSASTGTVNLNGSTSDSDFTVHGGRLNVNGSVSGGNITVHAGTLGGHGFITNDVIIGSAATLEVGNAGLTDRALLINGTVTSSGTMRFRVDDESAANRDLLTVGSVDLSGSHLDLIFQDASVTAMRNPSQLSAFLADPSSYSGSSVYQIISGNTSNNFANLATMETYIAATLGFTEPQSVISSGDQVFWVANTIDGIYLVAVPESNAILLATGGLFGLLLARRRHPTPA